VAASLRGLLGRFEDWVASALMAAILVVLALQVGSRVIGAPLSWTEEVARHLFIWMVFFGGSGAIRDRSHVSIDLAVRALPRRTRLLVALSGNVLVLFFLCNVIYWGARAVARMWSIPTVTLEIPFGAIYLVLPIAGVLMTLRTVLQMAEDAERGDPLASGATALHLD
jgi:TRAP-type C4-dicarboxylate transport system permease small subunit